MHYIYVTCCAFMFAACVTMIFHPDYEDGLLGRLALTVIAIPCGMVMMDAWDGTEFAPLRSSLWILVGVSVFTARQLYRFFGNLRKKKHGDGNKSTDVSLHD